MHPAREVGGDLYDFFFLPDRRLFVVVADVAGKGLAAALFMAVSKALTKSYSLRGRIDLVDLLALINRELARDNPDDLFVTMMAVVLDLDSGRLEYCNAGHEPLLLLVRADDSVQVLDEGGGPPLCALEDASYLRASVQLQPGDWVALLSDGITESMSPDGDLFGREAVRSLLRSTDQKGSSAEFLGRHLLERVAEFEAGVDQVDDQTLLLLHWLGPLPGGGAKR
jgi:sigma-B regulation protein RsbU (phosphoserine phosphatase)